MGGIQDLIWTKTSLFTFSWPCQWSLLFRTQQNALWHNTGGFLPPGALVFSTVLNWVKLYNKVTLDPRTQQPLTQGDNRAWGELGAIQGNYLWDRVTGLLDMTSQTIYLSRENECRLLLGHINLRAGWVQLKAALPPERKRHKSNNTYSSDLRDLSMLSVHTQEEGGGDDSEGRDREGVRLREMLLNYCTQGLFTRTRGRKSWILLEMKLTADVFGYFIVCQLSFDLKNTFSQRQGNSLNHLFTLTLHFYTQIWVLQDIAKLPNYFGQYCDLWM